MPVNFLETSVFVPEVTPLTILTVLLSVELSAILRFILVVNTSLFLFVHVKLAMFAKLILSMRVLT